MAKIIYFKKEEKLAILKVMIDLSNHYSINRGIQFIQETAKYFDLDNKLSEAFIMPLSEAQCILENSLNNESSKEEFVHLLLSNFLHDSRFNTNGVFNAHLKYANSVTGKFIKQGYTLYSWNPMIGSIFHLIKDETQNTSSAKHMETIKNNNYNKTLDIDSIQETLYKDL